MGINPRFQAVFSLFGVFSEICPILPKISEKKLSTLFPPEFLSLGLILFFQLTFLKHALIFFRGDETGIVTAPAGSFSFRLKDGLHSLCPFSFPQNPASFSPWGRREYTSANLLVPPLLPVYVTAPPSIISDSRAEVNKTDRAQ